MPAPHINPSEILNSYRKSDAVIIVFQDNARKVIEIAAVNEEAARVTGYASAYLMKKPLETVLSPRVSSTIAEFIEYADDSNDLLAVLSKVRNFSIQASDGREVEFKLRIIRGEAVDHNPWFHLVLIDEGKLRDTNALRATLKEDFKAQEVIDARSQLPDRASLFKNMAMVMDSVREGKVSASFAVIDINHYERLRAEYGSQAFDSLYRHIGQICKLKLRAEDTVCSLSPRSLGVLLIDAEQQSAHMVLNRLRWVIGASPLEIAGKEDLVAQVNIFFSGIDGKISGSEIVEKCEEFAAGQRSKANNSIQLVLTHERREKREDRRKMDIAVDLERRRKDRRKD